MKIKKIDSETNTTFKLFLKLTTARGIKKNSLALLSGPKQVAEMLKEFSGQCAGLVNRTQWRDLLHDRTLSAKGTHGKPTAKGICLTALGGGLPVVGTG